MASLRVRTDRKGVRHYNVLWREPDGTQTSWSTTDRAHARRVLAYLQAMGPLPRAEVIRDDDQPADMPTLDEWARRHIDSLTGLTAGTVADYRKLYQRTYGPLLGSKLVSELTRTHVAAALNSLTRDKRVTRAGTERAPLSRKSIANAHGLLSAMLSSAQEDGLIAKNPARGLRLPQARHDDTAEHRFLTPAEFERLLGTLEPHYRPLVAFLGGTGCRWGEAAALTVGDIDVERATARITKASKWQASGPRPIGPPKSRKSNRTIALPAALVTMLEPLLDRPAGERLFTAVKGGEVQHRYVRAKIWVPACDAAGLVPRPRIHDCRHSHVYWLIAAGVPLPVIQDRLGHEKITTTIDTYGHLSPDMRIQAAKAADVVLTTRAVAQLPVRVDH